MAVKQTITTKATALQKENFITKFAEIVKDNKGLQGNYKIQFFDSPAKSNYVFNGLDGKSINILSMLAAGEADKYRILKQNWQG